MSWRKFKRNVVRVMKNNPTSYKQVAAIIAMEYDMAMRSPKSGDFVAGNMLVKGNRRALQKWIEQQFRMQSMSPTPLPIINMISYGFVLYWSGAKLAMAKVPILCPIPGGVNISLVSNDVIFPGKPPTLRYPVGKPTSIEQFVDYLILAAQMHVPTVNGLMQVAWIYPTAPPGGGVAPMPWSGYRIPPPLPNPPIPIPS
jgi:hypothetical protein